MEYDDFRQSFDQFIGWKKVASSNFNLISGCMNPVAQCLVNMKTLHESVNQPKNEFLVDQIRNFYQFHYLNVFDLDWKIDEAMRKLNLTMDDVDDSEMDELEMATQNFRAIFFYDKLNIWKKGFKVNLRYDQDLREAVFQMNSPLSHHYERYVYYQS